MFGSNLQKQIGDAAKKEYADRIIKDMQEMHSSLFSSATNYANAIIFAGYAGLFAVWTITKDNLDKLLSGIVGILLVISIGAFVIFEIYKMLKVLSVQLKFVKSVHKSDAPDNVIKSLDELKKQEKLVHNSMMAIWLICFSISISTGFASGAVLLWSLINSVIESV